MNQVFIREGRAGNGIGEGRILPCDLIGNGVHNHGRVVHVLDGQCEPGRSVQAALICCRHGNSQCPYIVIEWVPSECTGALIEAQPRREGAAVGQHGIVDQGIPMDLIEICEGGCRYGEREGRIFKGDLIGQRRSHGRYFVYIGDGEHEHIEHARVLLINRGDFEIETPDLRVIRCPAKRRRLRIETQPGWQRSAINQVCA